uniref:Uncharacterized protein n=1 Tax=Engystomops pustulosus TaxID=76066 RepID=A0AAV6YU79_ENGPU|nr:hypothetical protein GDO81_019602 [Engystomops pustulosus]
MILPFDRCPCGLQPRGVKYSISILNFAPFTIREPIVYVSIEIKWYYRTKQISCVFPNFGTIREPSGQRPSTDPDDLTRPKKPSLHPCEEPTESNTFSEEVDPGFPPNRSTNPS